MTEPLLEVQVQWDVRVAILRRGDDLFVTNDWGAPSPTLRPLTDAVQAVWTEPLVLAGLLPPGVRTVRKLDPEAWERVDVRDGAWLARAAAESGPEALDRLAFVDAAGAITPLSEHPLGRRLAEIAPDPPPRTDPTEEERAYADALATAIAADVVTHPPPGPLVRIVIRWFDSGDPAYLTIHVLAAGHEPLQAGEAWYPLEWGRVNVDRELDRTDRVLADPAFRAAAGSLVASLPRDADGDAHLFAVSEAAVRVPDALRAHSVGTTERFAVSIAHFEGWGMLDQLQGTAPAELLAALEAHGELPPD